MKRFIPILSVLALLASLTEARLWKDQDGREMSADYVESYERDGVKMVVFTKGDGMRYQVPLSRLSQEDQAYIAKIEANGGVDPSASPTTSSEPAMTLTAFEEAISKDLVIATGNRVGRHAPDEFQPKPYYAIYYSAHWCPPCKKFTPKLVDFYNDSADDNFEIIFVSSDRDEESMENYMTEYSMPWPALEFDKKKRSKELTQFSARGIPCLVLVDRNGKVIKHSYEGDTYVGPTSVMNELANLLKEKRG
ncbi:thioredoxin-like domain-containing protein [Cerasicoccus fimbriatus]|uniref:thioredoxin-like domain-containing protein n=1 Tax=Cerasicoccus fimbriatus TaxID=3014554 RepID=UPI0022B50846|nr:thioredoxin-like domain-containing protein [Cerasicoccus sp. TK19100]